MPYPQAGIGVGVSIGSAGKGASYSSGYSAEIMRKVLVNI